MSLQHLEDYSARIERFISAREWRLLHPYAKRRPHEHDRQQRLRYRSLQRGPDEAIRLLLLYPPNPSSVARGNSYRDTIHGKFVRASLNNPPSYEALSYTWDNPFANPWTVIDPDLKCRSARLYQAWRAKATDHHIYVNGRIVKVGQNLYDALLAYRHPSEKRLIWVDALCINQADDNEKRHQVSIMNHIYRRARSVFVWLGPDISRVGSAPSANDNQEDNGDDDDDDAAPRGPLQSSELITGNRTALLKARIFISSWFQRLWIVQEVAVASDIIFRCGSKFLDHEEMESHLGLENFMDLAAVGFGSPTDAALINEAIRCYSRIARARFNIGNVRLDFAVYLWRRSLCREPRDRVYALLSLAHQPDGRLLLDPDYSVPLTEISQQLVLRSIATSESLDVLRYVDHARTHGFAQRLPTWSFPLDLGTELSSGRIDRRDDLIVNNVIASLEPAGRLPHRALPTLLLQTSGEHTLILSGIIVYTINVVGPTLYKSQHALSYDCEEHSTGNERREYRTKVRAPVAKEDVNCFRAYKKTDESSRRRPAVATLDSLHAAGFQKKTPEAAIESMYSHGWITWNWDFPDYWRNDLPYIPPALRTMSIPRLMSADTESTRASAPSLHSLRLQRLSRLVSVPSSLHGLFSTQMREPEDSDDGSSLSPEGAALQAAAFERYSNARYPGEMYSGRRLALTHQHTHAIVPESTRVGDIVVMLSHSRNPFILRPYSPSHESSHQSRSKGFDHRRHDQDDDLVQAVPSVRLESNGDDQSSEDRQLACTFVGACYLEHRLEWDAFEALGAHELTQIHLY